MSYCINPWCGKRENPDDAEVCQSCDTPLLSNKCYRAVKLFKALKQQPSREGVQKVLSNPDFQLTGATGVIQFEKGDRKEVPSLPGYVIKKVVPKCSGGYIFVPVEHKRKCL